ncbi:MAG: HU family DNA-binding protein [Spirochaetia bacterium]|nr:HU family DNA-binding protein [Spirochaetia bacterium]
MTKDELVSHMAGEASITKEASKKALEAFISGITKTLKKGGTVGLVGFGTFSITKRAARKGRNPKTGETIQIAASKSVKFKVGKSLKDAVK